MLSSQSARPAGGRFLLLLLAAFASAALGVGALFFQRQRASIRANAQEEIQAIARLKVESIQRWRQERIGDAQWIADSAIFPSEARSFFAQPGDGGLRDKVARWLEGWQRSPFYSHALLFDRDAAVRLALPATPSTIDSELMATIRAVRRSGQIVFRDLHLDANSGQPSMELIIPLVPHEAGAVEVAGVLVLIIDPERFLFPHIQSWPNASRSAETLLVRREGDQVIYLNELRHRSGAALKLRSPLTDPTRPAARAATGQTGVMVGRDYRDEPVLAALAAIPDSPWFLVAKRDLAEIDEAVWRWAWFLGGAELLLIVAATTGIGFVWRTREMHYARRDGEQQEAAAAAARESARQLGETQRVARLGSYVLDVRTGTWTSSPILDEIFGLTGTTFRKDVAGWLQLVHPDDRAEMQQHLQQDVLGAHQRFDHSYRIIRQQDGAERWLHGLGELVLNERGEPIQMIGSIQDITTRKLAELALRKSEAMLSETGRMARVGGWSIELASGTLTWTREVYAIHEVPADFQLTVASAISFYAPDSRQVISAAVERAVAAGEAFDLELEVITARGRRIWVRAQGHAIQENGRAITVVGTFQDITDRKEIMLALRDSQQRLALHVEQTPLAVMEWDADFRVTAWNPAAEQIFGYTAVEARGRTASELIVPAAQHGEIARLWTELLTGRDGRRRTIDNVTRDGRALRCEWFNTPLHDAGGRVTAVASLVLDVTERRRHEQEREALLRELERKNAELEGMIYVASHDLRGPLINVQGFGKRLDQECRVLLATTAASGPETAPSAARILKSLHYIQTSADKMDRLIAGMLRVSRLGRSAPDWQNVDMEKLVNDVVTTLTIQMQTAGAEVAVEALPPCRADPLLLSQVFANLLDNALKYRDPRRPLRLRCTGEVRDGEVIYCVADTGVGMAREHQERIWEMFHRLYPDGAVPGDGLGLNVVRRIVDRHHGRTWVSSVPGEGSQFFVALPVSR